MTSIPGNKLNIGNETLTIIANAKKFNKWMYEEIKPYLSGGILEIGSGIGNISCFVLKDKFETTLSDYNSNYTKLLIQKFADSPNLQSVLSIDLQETDFCGKYSSLHEKFDSIFLLNVIEHLKDDLSAVTNCKYMLKPGGQLILLAPAYNFLFCDLDRNLGHYRRYTAYSLARLLQKNNMLVSEKKYFNLAGITGWLVWGKLFNKRQLNQGSMGIFDKLVPLFRIADRLVGRKTGLSAIAAGKKI